MMDDGQRRDEILRRSEEMIARADAVLAQPRPVYDRLWEAPEPAPVRSAPARAEAPAARPAAPPAASRAWVNGAVERAMAACLRGVSTFVVQQRDALRLRHAESERRLADLEARVAELERSR